jgi:hypothetical protein
MKPLTPQQLDEIKSFIETQRATCLWFFNKNLSLDTTTDLALALEGIKKHAQRQGYISARKYLSWL